MVATSNRIATLDLIRGIAVLGILAVNIAGFAGPQLATLTPNWPTAASTPDEMVFAGSFLLFEGKMRALFSLLFGASMLLFIERAEAQRRNGDLLQARRLGWLALFGWLHYILLWWGDILFDYALCGMMALALRRLSVGGLAGAGLLGFLVWHGLGAMTGLPDVVAAEHVRLGIATAAEAQHVAAALATAHQGMAADVAQAHLGFWAMAANKFATAPLWPLVLTFASFGETLPLMLLGMALYRSGLTAGDWPRRWVVAMMVGGLALGGPMALALTGWAWVRHFPPLVMPDVMAYWAGPEHLALALAYYAALVLAAPGLLATGVGQRLAAAGRMAFSNYLGTTMIMTAIFYGWGLGLFGHVSHAIQPLFVLAAWALMLAWSKPWLARFHQGPLEWLWRSATELRWRPFRV